MSVVWAASCDRNFGGMLENSFEHSEIRIAFQQAASEVLQKMHIRKKNEQKFTFSANFLVFGLRRVAVASGECTKCRRRPKVQLRRFMLGRSPHWAALSDRSFGIPTDLTDSHG